MSAEQGEVMDDLFGEDDEDQTEQEETTRDPSCGALAFHDGTEEALFVYLRQHAVPGNVSSILQAIDAFCYQRHWMMHIGDQKRQVIEATFLEAKTKREQQTENGFVAVELGSYCGYSALVFAQHLDADKGQKLFCIEAHPKCVSYTRRMVELAQLTSVVTVVSAPASDVSQWKTHLPEGQLVDFLFVDHDKNSYFADVKATVEARVLRSGACVVADNVLCFNKPLYEYLDYVRDNRPDAPFCQSILHEGFLEYTTEAEREGSDGSALKDGIEVSIVR